MSGNRLVDFKIITKPKYLGTKDHIAVGAEFPISELPSLLQQKCMRLQETDRQGFS